MKVRIRTRQLTVTIMSLVVFLGVVGTVQSLTLPADITNSPEVGFTSLSPRGASGGSIVPASCESGVWDSTWDWGHPDGDNSGVCAVYGCTDTAARNYNPSATASDGSCTYLPAPTLNFSPASVPYGTGSTVVWSWPETGGTRYCDIRTYGSEWNGYANGQDISGSYNSGGMNASGSASATCYWYRPSTSSYISSPQANATLTVGPRNTCYPSADPANYGAKCTSSANACGSTNTGTINCSGACTASTPANPSGYGSSCTSAANACGTTNTGTINCSGACTASTPANPSGYGSSCTSSANACGSTNTGTINCSGACTASTPANPSGYGSSCTSAANACGSTNTGTINCSGACTASTPANPSGYGSSCTSAANACGQTQSNGTIQCNGTCSSTSPAMPAGYGSQCSSIPNACGQTRNNGTIQCNGSCSSTPPPSANCSPDLTAGSTTASPSSGTTGQSESFTSTVSNVGIGDASNFPNIFQIADSDITTTIAMLNAGTASLSSGASTGVSSTYIFSSAGSYNVRSCANFNTSWTGSIAESNANNNCGAWLPLTVSWAPCTNGANNPPTCSQCPANLAYVSGSCVACSNGGCTGTGGSASNPLGGLSCNNGALNPHSCNIFTPTATLSASPNPVVTGQSSTLTWGSTNTTSCVGTGFTAGGTSGSRSTGPLTQNPTSYSVTCTGPGGSATDNESITVLQPTADISANPARVQTGTPSLITWSTSNVNSCTISGPGLSSTSLSGSQNVQINSQATFTINCITNGSPVTDSVMVNVIPVFKEF
ncbi:MAG: CARDB domain-containing protein [bacterium]|nr:CARDB domain-containing protein [bacterium]